MQAFAPSALARSIRAGDPKRFKLDLKADKKKLLAEIAESASKGEVELDKFDSLTVRGRQCVSYSRLDAHLVLRTIARHLRRRRRIVVSSRDQIVRGVIESLVDATPMYVLRRDIASFYESISVSDLRERLLYDTGTPTSVRRYLQDYFSAHCSHADVGIPRGIGLSAVLAEIALQNFDQRVREIPGVYKYYRFADDIVVFSFVPAAELAPKVSNCLPAGMKFNAAKRQDIPLDSDTTHAKSVALEYLGYRFTMTDQCGAKYGRVVTVGIAQKKLNKFKSRLILSLKAYAAKQDFELLRDRIAYISSNYEVRRHGLAVVGGATHVKSGIFYNYKHCGEYRVSKKLRLIHSRDQAAQQLRGLDAMLHYLCSAKSPFSAFLSKLSDPQKKTLLQPSFEKGYAKRMMVRFSPARVRQLKACWREV